MLKYFNELGEGSVTRTFGAGSTIFYQGEVPRSAALLLAGVVRVFSISAQGDEQIVMFHVGGEFFPSSWIFGKSTSTLFFYEALTDCSVTFVPRAELIDFMLARSERMHAMLDYFTTNYAASLIRVNALEQPKAKDKLVYTLYFLCQRYGQATDGDVAIPIALTHQNLASLVGLTRETTAMEMGRLKKQKVLSYKQQKYIIHMDRLLEIIGEDSFRDISIAD